MLLRQQPSQRILEQNVARPATEDDADHDRCFGCHCVARLRLRRSVFRLPLRGTVFRWIGKRREKESVANALNLSPH